MTLILHDLENELFLKTPFSRIDDSVVINPNDILPCIGCFKCWTELPGTCALKDKYSNNSLYFKNADKVIIISKNYYGSYSPIIKNFFDRSISYVKPQFRKVYDEMHHVKRYKKKLNIEYYFYGDIEDNEKETLEKLIKANQENLDSNVLINIIDIGEYCYE